MRLDRLCTDETICPKLFLYPYVLQDSVYNTDLIYRQVPNSVYMDLSIYFVMQNWWTVSLIGFTMDFYLYQGIYDSPVNVI